VDRHAAPHRSLSHSLLLVPPLLLLAWYLASGHRRRVVAAVTVGYLVHLATDALYPLLAGDLARIGFLAWPVTPAGETAATQGIIAHFLTFELTPHNGFEILLFAAAAVAWLLDGIPGYRWVVETTRAIAERTRDAVTGT
jgi:hypothetical protein